MLHFAKLKPCLQTLYQAGRLAKGKHYSLLRKIVNYGQKKFYNFGPWSHFVVLPKQDLDVQQTHLLKIATSATKKKKFFLMSTRWRSVVNTNPRDNTLSYGRVAGVILLVWILAFIGSNPAQNIISVGYIKIPRISELELVEWVSFMQ